MTSVVSILKNKYALILTLALLAEGILYYSAFGSEKVPQNQPLEMFATEFSGWQMISEGHVEKEVMDMLRADDTLTRSYAKAAYSVPAGFFVAYFRTQRTGQAVHSPKNCLPGSGWEPLQEGYITVPVSVEPRSIQINRYIVARGENASVVLYWYQTRTRVIASDYSAKIWLVLDSMRYHRSDTALVRVIVPVLDGNDAQATQTGVDFVQSMFPLLQRYLPG
jgi:EpsI family protein